MDKMKKIAIGILVIGVIAAVAIFFMKDSDKSIFPKTVATVNGEKITSAEFEEFKKQVFAQQGIDTTTLDAETRKQIETSILDNLVSQKILDQAARDAGITVSDEEVNTEFNLIKEQFGGEEEFLAALATENISENKIKEQIKQGLTQDKYLNQQVNFDSVEVTEDDIKNAFEQISAGQEIGSLEENRENLEMYVQNQKRQVLIVEFVTSLKDSAEIEILI